MSWINTTEINLFNIYHGEFSDFNILKKFINDNGFNKMNYYLYHRPVKEVLTAGGFYASATHDNRCRPPYIDHARYFKNTKTGTCCLTFNPYQTVEAIREEVDYWCFKNGLVAEYSAQSWYYPGSTCFVVIHLPEKKVHI